MERATAVWGEDLAGEGGARRGDGGGGAGGSACGGVLPREQRARVFAARQTPRGHGAGRGVGAVRRLQRGDGDVSRAGAVRRREERADVAGLQTARGEVVQVCSRDESFGAWSGRKRV